MLKLSYPLLALFFLFSSVYSQTIPSASDINQKIASTLTVSSGIVGALYAIIGLLFVFFGYKLFRLVLFAIGFYIGSALGYIILLNVQPSGGFSEWVYFGVSLAVGIVFGFLFLCFYKLGIAGLGAFGGFTLAVYILSFKSGGLISNEIGRIVFIVVLILVGLVVALWLEKPAIIVATSVIGSVSTLIGIDVFAQTGVSAIIISFVTSSGQVSSSVANSITATQYGILGAMAALAIIGIVVQFRITRGQNDIHRHAGYRRSKNEEPSA